MTSKIMEEIYQGAFQEAYQEGVHQSQVTIALRMIEHGYSTEDISIVTSLPISDVEALRSGQTV